MKIPYLCASILSSASFSAVLWSIPLIAVGESEQYPALEIHGFLYSNACAANVRIELQNSLLKLGIKEADKAWQIIDTLICAPRNESTRSTIRAVMAKRIKEDFASTGDLPSFEMVVPDAQIIERVMRDGEAWKAQVRKETDNVIVQYFVDEACVRDVTLRYYNSKWLIYGIGMACD